MTGENSAETVTWINVIPLNRREKIARWWIESVRQQQTHTSRRQRERPFQTRIPVDSIDDIACDGLSAALHRQRQQVLEDDNHITLPRANPDGTQFFGSVTIPRRSLGVTFTEQGIVPNEH